ncbi:hypothetical protein BCR44DRAFT_1251418 [Catenaria anguillulae PL171]|uniref:Uncharacterized protein n=1 Tax=Catenaria anguillulae PL171 TaxID=765915 RepID=A0A1Y2HYD5_9FUNG|nr:hypothetical protein BCR44DRAFT_1251418 [Catenaria anguillulae PL171]
MDPSFSSSPSTGNPNAMPPRPLKRSASSEPPLPSSSPASSTAAKRQRSLYDFFSRSSSPAAPPANTLKREPIMSPTRGHVYPVSSPLATASSPGATVSASALTSPTKPRPATHQRPQAFASSSAAAAATAASFAPAPARSTPAAISLQLGDSSDDENKVASVAPETPRRVRVRPNVRPVQIEILVLASHLPCALVLSPRLLFALALLHVPKSLRFRML